MIERTLPIVNRLGLHARASAKVVQLASQFASTLLLVHRGREINAKSIMGLMMLAAGKGSELLLKVEGPDEAAAADAIAALCAVIEAHRHHRRDRHSGRPRRSWQCTHLRRFRARRGRIRSAIPPGA